MIVRIFGQRTTLSRFGRGAIVAIAFLVALWSGSAPPASAQTAATGSGVAGTARATPYGGITLPSVTATATTTATTTAAASTATKGSGASAGGSGAAASGSAAAAVGSGLGTSNGSATATNPATSTASAPAATGTAPAWLLCPPAGAGGSEPFVAGTNLSCAP
jgi:hypothetical protein